MGTDTRHVAERLDVAAQDVYAYASNPEHLIDWAPGLGTSVEQLGGAWFVETTTMGRVTVAFAPPNAFGVLDHEVTLPSGEVFLNPMRVVPYGAGSEVVFSVRRQPGVSDEDFDRDAGHVAADLARLRQILESRQASGRQPGL